MKEQREMIRGSILGAIIGDALGVPVEFESRASLKKDPVTGMFGHGTHNQPLGTWSDDSSLLLCQMQSIVDCGKINYADQAKKFIKWKENAYWTARGRVFDIGNTTSEAISRMKSTKDVTRSGLNGFNSQGNGSLMRILPACIFLARDSQDVRMEKIMKCGSMTHRHEVCGLACNFYADMVSTIFGTASRWIDFAYKMAVEKFKLEMEKHPEFSRIIAPKFGETKYNEIKGSGWVVHSLEAAIWLGLRSQSYEDGVLSAVNMGEDTDTTACIAGGLLGAQFWVSRTFESWAKSLAQIARIEKLIEDFTIVCEEHWADFWLLDV